MAAANERVRHIKLVNVPIETFKNDIEQYSFFLTNLIPGYVELTHMTQNCANWLLEFSCDIGLLNLVYM